jgi:transposase
MMFQDHVVREEVLANELWACLEPLIPVHSSRFRYPGRGRADDRARLHADRGHNHDKYRRPVRARGITPVIARRGTECGSGLGKVRWPVEHTFAWLKSFRLPRVRTERRADVHQAILSLACSIICLRKLILNWSLRGRSSRCPAVV